MRDHATLPEPDPGAGDRQPETDGPDGAVPVWWADRPDDGSPEHETAARRRRWLLLAAFVETLLIIVGLAWLVTGRDSDDERAAAGSRAPDIVSVVKELQDVPGGGQWIVGRLPDAHCLTV